MKMFPLIAFSAVLLTSCASGAFKAFEGSVPPDQICTLSIDPVENGKVTIAAVNGVTANATEALLQGESENQVALTFTDQNGSVTQTVPFTAPAGASCKASATTEERNFKMGSAETRAFVTLWIECGGAVVAGSDNSDNMEMVK